MAIEKYESLRKSALEVRDERRVSANTAVRIGSLLVGIVDALSAADGHVGGYVGMTPVQLAQGLQSLFGIDNITMSGCLEVARSADISGSLSVAGVSSLKGVKADVLQLGDAVLTWNREKGGLMLSHRDGASVANLFSTGDMVAFGTDAGEEPGSVQFFGDLLDDAIRTPVGWSGKAWGYNGSSWGFVDVGKNYNAGYGLRLDTVLRVFSVNTDIIASQAWVNGQGFLKSGDIPAQADYELGTNGDKVTMQKNGAWHNEIRVPYASAASVIKYVESPDSYKNLPYLTAYQTVESDVLSSYLAFNRHDSSAYYAQIIRVPFFAGAPQYKRIKDSVDSGWYNFITDENIAVQSVAYAAAAGDASMLAGQQPRYYVDVVNNQTIGGYKQFTNSLQLVHDQKDIGIVCVHQNTWYDMLSFNGSSIYLNYGGQTTVPITYYGSKHIFYNGAEPIMSIENGSLQVLNKSGNSGAYIDMQASASYSHKRIQLMNDRIQFASTQHNGVVFQIDYLNDGVFLGSREGGSSGLIKWDASLNAFRFNGNIVATGDVIAFGGAGTLDIQALKVTSVEANNIKASSAYFNTISSKSDGDIVFQNGVNFGSNDATWNEANVYMLNGTWLYVGQQDSRHAISDIYIDGDYLYITLEDSTTKRFKSVP